MGVAMGARSYAMGLSSQKTTMGVGEEADARAGARLEPLLHTSTRTHRRVMRGRVGTSDQRLVAPLPRIVTPVGYRR